MPPRRTKPPSLTLEGIEADIWWENVARLENAEAAVWDAQAELALELRRAVKGLLQAEGSRLAAAVSDYNEAIRRVGIQVDEMRAGLQGEGPIAAQDALSGAVDALVKREVLLSPIAIHIHDVEIGGEGDLATDVEVKLSIPCFGDAWAHKDKAERKERGSVWDVIHKLPVRPGSGTR